MVKRIFQTPAPVLLLLASLLFPTELSLYVAGLRLPAHRLVLLLIIPFALWRLTGSGRCRMDAYDWFFFLFAGWTVFAFSVHAQDTSGLVFGGSLAIEALGGYLVARAYVRDERTFRATLSALFAAVILAALFALPETFLGRHFTHDALQAVTGYYHPRVLETRMGLTRAYGTFDHPIHLGTFCASIGAMIWYNSGSIYQRIGAVAIVAVATLSAVSSAPLLCLAIQIGLIVWDRLTAKLARRVWLTLLGIAMALAVLSQISNRSVFALIATGLTLDSWTGFYRLLIWEYGTASVMEHPWLGIGLGDWVRPYWMFSDTVDAFWLVIAMRTGLPGVSMLLLAIVLLMMAVVRKSAGRPERHHWMKAWCMALIALTLVVSTVHLWNAVHAYFFFFLGLGGWLADPLRQRATAQSPAEAAPAAQRRRSQRGPRPRRPVGAAAAGGVPGLAYVATLQR